MTSAANPRNLERVPRGARFRLSMVYDVEDANSMQEDFENLRLAIELLHDDSLGGHGSRGYGQVKLRDYSVLAKRISHYRGKEAQYKEWRDRESVRDIDIKELVSFFEEVQAKENGGG